MPRRPIAPVLVTLGILASSGLFAGTALPITPDGFFGDWKKVEPLHSDSPGDVAAGSIDLGNLFIANDADALYLRFEVGVETILQNGPNEAAGNNLRLLLDLDNSVSTGRPAEGLGVEIEIGFGQRSIQVFDTGGSAFTWMPEPLGIMGLPTHSATEFELRVPFAAARSDSIVDHLRSGGSIALVLVQVSGDRQPDSGTIGYATSTEAVKPTKLPKKRTKYFRLMTMNVERTNIEREQELYTRLPQAIRPDIIAFQEIDEWTAEATGRLVAEALPLPDGRQWEAFQVEDTVTVSSFPIVSGAAIDDNQVTLIDLPND